ncbi:MAG: hypothetical protein GVY04_21760 [Cyanobacteria bacterium]|jgi:hypothetical protein|nr:hypothetical protein [Cyanobacteria bacterium GSL.Bin1]
MILKSVINLLNFTTLTFFIASPVLAELNEINNCPNQNADINEIVDWERQEDGTQSPKVKKHNAYIITQMGKFDCQVEWITAYRNEWWLRCGNGSNIWTNITEGIFVQDRKGSMYKMKFLNYNSSATCHKDKVIYQDKVTAYQKSFQFDILIESIYQRKKTPRPSGF